MPNIFEIEYNKLNKEQKDAVESTEGPVMVVAGPGTGKTQVLALRIANILVKTDTKADGILCLTFTNSGVKAMKERLQRYISKESSKVNVSTFHKFAMELISENYSLLSLSNEPKLLDDKDAIMLCDKILFANEWEYLRPRNDTSRYFRDLKSLISLLKRERISPEDFEVEINSEIEKLQNDPSNISSRGESKGKLKKEILNKIESLEKTKEVVKFYKLYEKEKEENNFFDYDDYLEKLVLLVEENEDLRSDIREKYLYILIDEHQDSSGVQNEFLEIIWGEIEKPNIFVVGDDRQLIYGFGGASLAYFESFKRTFGKAKLITLLENYRSTQNILDASEEILRSSISEGKLKSQQKNGEPINLIENDYPRDEVIYAGIAIKEKVEKDKINLEDCAILVPKNKFIKNTISVLNSMGIKTASTEALNLFEIEETESFLRVLKIINNPYDDVMLSRSFFDKCSGISPLDAHKFIKNNDMKDFSLFSVEEPKQHLFEGISQEKIWINKLKNWILLSKEKDPYDLVQIVGNELLLEGVKEHNDLVLRVEIIRSLLHLILSEREKNKEYTLGQFLDFVDRIKEYGEKIPIASFHKDDGVKIITMHASKGLEFDFVHILHMDEGSFERGKKGGFVLPEKIKEKQNKKDEEDLKRELYVAITRAKKYCNISFARFSYEGKEQNLSSIVSDIDEKHFNKINAKNSEATILEKDLKIYVKKEDLKEEKVNLDILAEMVKKEYEDKTISVSMLNNFFECPWKWYFRSFLQLPEEESESLIFGNKVHKAIDIILKEFKTNNKKAPNKKELEDICGKDMRVLEVVEKWVENYYSSIAKNFFNEKSVSVKDENFPHLNIYGKIDLIEKEGEFVSVTDFKTGHSKKSNEIEKIDEFGKMSSLMRQLAMYSYLLKKSPKWKMNVSECKLLFVEAENKKEELYKTFIDEEKIDLLIADIKDYDEAIKDKNWFLRPCNFKNYGKADAKCEYCKMGEIYRDM